MKFQIIALLAGLLFFTGINSTIQAQKSEPKTDVHLSIKARNFGDKVVLRWGFSEPEAWRYLNTYGYMVERLELDDKTNKATGNQQFIAIGGGPVKPWTKEQWAAKITARDTFAVIAAQCLLGESSVMPDPDGNMFRTLQLQQSEDANRFTFALMAADLSPLASEGLGLRIEDKNIQKGKKYIYRLRANQPESERFRMDTALVVVATDDIFAPEVPASPEIISGDSLVTLKWRKPSGFTVKAGCGSISTPIST